MRLWVCIYLFCLIYFAYIVLGAEPHHHRTFEEIQWAFTLQDRGLQRPPECPAELYVSNKKIDQKLYNLFNCEYFSWLFIMDCLSEQHRRPRFAGSIESPSSALYRLKYVKKLAKFGSSFFSIFFLIAHSNQTK